MNEWTTAAARIGAVTLALAAGMDANAVPAAGAEAPSVPAGRRLAQRHCGGCHAVGEGVSPLPDAPTFPTLHHRYRAGCLDQALSQGMLAPLRPPEEGAAEGHPRMPMRALADDELADLRAYLRSLDPRPTPAEARCPRDAAAGAGERGGSSAGIF